MTVFINEKRYTNAQIIEKYLFKLIKNSGYRKTQIYITYKSLPDIIIKGPFGILYTNIIYPKRNETKIKDLIKKLPQTNEFINHLERYVLENI